MSNRKIAARHWPKLHGWLEWKRRRASRRAGQVAPALIRQVRASVDDLSVRAGSAFLQAGASLIRFPHRREQVPLPEPLTFEGRRFDVVEDLVEYTTLGREHVHALIRRELEDFRLEWHAAPTALREDTWFYTASRTYLFGNAVHVHEEPRVVELLASFAANGSRVLDFGGGSGNLALGLAAAGLYVDFLELSALQKDFVRFRTAKHGLTDRVRVLDRWNPLPAGGYDLVCAFDVFEHLPDLRSTLEMEVLPSLASNGVLAERSPFARNVANPMHHEDDIGLDSLLERHGLRIVLDDPLCRVWGR